LQAGTQNVPMMLFGRFVGGCMWLILFLI
jgi:hypothetical protein